MTWLELDPQPGKQNIAVKMHDETSRRAGKNTGTCRAQKRRFQSDFRLACGRRVDLASTAVLQLAHGLLLAMRALGSLLWPLSSFVAAALAAPAVVSLILHPPGSLGRVSGWPSS